MSNSKWSIRKVVRSLVPTSVQPANVTVPGEDSTVALIEQPIHEPVLTTPGYHGPAQHEKPLWEEQLDEPDLDLAPDDPILLWNKAYNAIKRNNGDLVTTFEKILKEDIIGGDSGENQVGFSDINGQYRLVLMKLAVEKSIQKVKTHEAFKEGVLTLSTLVVDLKGVGDAIMSSQPPAAMAWSGICAILPILTRSLLQEQAMVEGLNHVISKMEWYLGLGSYVVMDQWQDNRQLSKLKATLEKRILNVYESMLEYQMRSVTHCYDKHPVIRGVKTILGSNDWRTRNKELERRERDAEKELSQYSDWHGNSIFDNIARNTETTLAHLRHQFGQTKLGERATAIGRFKTTCYEQLMEAIPPRVPGTCEWLRKHAKFTEWNQQKFGLLLISAGPGCGKSVLARYLVQDVLPFGDPAATVAYFFFRENERSIPNALSAMIHQILCSLSSLLDSCIAEVQALGPNLLSDLASLWRVFELIVGHPNKRQIICVLDALNECGDAERKKFNQLLRKFLRRKFSHSPRVKFLIMTREDPDILEEFRGFESMHSVQLSEESKKRDVTFEGCDVPVQIRSIDLLEDINVVIAHRLRQLLLTKAMNQDAWQLVASALEQSPSEPRTYLWVSSVFDVLEQNLDDTVKKWEQLVQRPPGTLFRAYEDMLRDISEEERKKVTRLFRLMIAAEKPMTLHELNVALHVQDRRTIYFESDLAHPSNKSFQKWLARTCGGFVAEFDNRIMFVHRSAKAFLLGPDDKSASRQEIERGKYLWQGSITIVQAHRTAAENCILYLSLGVLSTTKFREVTRVFNKALGGAQVKLQNHSLRPDDFLDYAYDQCEQVVREQGLSTYSLYSLRNWVSHFYCAQVFDQDTLVRDINPDLHATYFSLFDDTPPLTRPWLVMAAQVLEEDCGYRLTEFESETGLISCHRSVGKAALASLFGHHRATEQFLEQEMPSEIEAETRLDDFVIEPPNVQYQPIFFSATVGHLISLRYILAKMGPSYQNARDQLGRTPLHQAARLGRYECLTSLADHFNIAEEDAHGWTAFDYLMHRINGLHDLEATRDTIRALIEARGERRDTRSPKGISLLSIAAKSPNETILEKTCRPEMAGDIVNSRFFQIAYEGSLIKFLVDHGEDVNRQESIGRFAPLHFALYHNHIWNAMFLLRAGANVSTADELQRTPLHLACRAAATLNIPLILALLEGGASPNSYDEMGLTPFHLAITHLDEAGDLLVELMLVYGAHPYQRMRGGQTALEIAYRAQWSGINSRFDLIEAWLLDTTMLWEIE